MHEFRKATPADIPELSKIRALFLKECTNIPAGGHDTMEAANKQYFEKHLPCGDFVAWLALDGEKIVATSGMCFYTVPPNTECPNGKVAYIMNIFTLPQYRKQGLAAKLFAKTVEEAGERGYKKITLNATDEGRPMYEKFGFKDVKGDMVFYL